MRRHGAVSAGVDTIMAGAGLTAGGFYAHFGKKDALLAELVLGGLDRLKHTLFAGIEDVRGVPFLATIARRYLSRRHRDDVEAGCIVPSVLGEMPRLAPEVRSAFEHGFDDFARLVTPHVPATGTLSARDRTLATLALFAGGIMLARGVDDPKLSDEILAACRRLAVPEAYVPNESERGDKR